jgi:hypothetical protein
VVRFLLTGPAVQFRVGGAGGEDWRAMIDWLQQNWPWVATGAAVAITAYVGWCIRDWRSAVAEGEALRQRRGGYLK